ncbi:hypothetical protein [Fontivita pretiosa]|uniref:hypothetical protein n=1 Tax=Fontivita pretiosa TaxID=2989684 RepID=UPI003D16D767
MKFINNDRPVDRRQFLQSLGFAAMSSVLGSTFGNVSHGADTQQMATTAATTSSRASDASSSADGVQIAGWNRFSPRFIDPPVFELVARPGARRYIGIIEQNGQRHEIASVQPRIDLRQVWPKLAHDWFTIALGIETSQGTTLGPATRRFRAWDWQGFDGQREDWAAAADRNIAFLIHAAEHAVAPYREPGVPVWIWSSAGPEPEKGNPQGRGDAYPAAHQPVFIRAFLAHARNERPYRKEAMRLTNFVGEWLLTHRHPPTGKLPLFPYSTIGMGKYEGGNEGAAVNITRACRTAEGMVDWYRATGREDALEYAIHIADTVMQFQRHDGSLPYRIEPATGAVVEDYTCDVINFTVLVEMLEQHRPDAKRAFAARRALDWTLAYPVTTNHWQGAFEDVREKRPFENLGNMGTILLICYLCRHADENPDYLPIARRLNRWVEDQFVIFRPDATIDVDCPVP